MSPDNYWTRKLNRRGVLAGTAAAGVGAAALVAVGCGGDDSSGSKPSATQAATSPAGSATTGPKISDQVKITNGQEKWVGKTPVKGGTLRQSYNTDPVTWDPHETTSIYTHLRTAMFNQPVLAYRFGAQYGTADVTPSPGLVSKWEQLDPTTVNLTVDPAANWTARAPLNGRKVTSSDLKFSLNRILTLPAPYAALYSLIDKMETPSDGCDLCFCIKGVGG